MTPGHDGAESRSVFRGLWTGFLIFAVAAYLLVANTPRIPTDLPALHFALAFLGFVLIPIAFTPTKRAMRILSTEPCASLANYGVPSPLRREPLFEARDNSPKLDVYSHFAGGGGLVLVAVMMAALPHPPKYPGEPMGHPGATELIAFAVALLGSAILAAGVIKLRRLRAERPSQ